MAEERLERDLEEQLVRARQGFARTVSSPAGEEADLEPAMDDEVDLGPVLRKCIEKGDTKMAIKLYAAMQSPNDPKIDTMTVQSLLTLKWAEIDLDYDGNRTTVADLIAIHEGRSDDVSFLQVRGQEVRPAEGGCTSPAWGRDVDSMVDEWRETGSAGDSGGEVLSD